MSEIKLKPCPFCGQIPNLYGQEVRDYVNGEWAELSRKEYWVQTQCHLDCLIGHMQAKAYGIRGEARYMNENAAVKAWNKRVEKTGKWIVKKDRFNSTYAVCSECGANNRAGNFKYCFDCGAKMEGYE